MAAKDDLGFVALHVVSSGICTNSVIETGPMGPGRAESVPEMIAGGNRPSGRVRNPVPAKRFLPGCRSCRPVVKHCCGAWVRAV